MWQVSKRQANALRVFSGGVLFILWLFILRDLGKAMRIYKADCDTKIVKIVWDYAEAMLGLWYSVVWDYAGTIVRYYWLY